MIKDLDAENVKIANSWIFCMLNIFFALLFLVLFYKYKIIPIIYNLRNKMKTILKIKNNIQKSNTVVI